MPHTVYLSLGSNVGDRAAQIADAIARLQAVGHVTATSSLYETSPVEVTNQPWFLNAVVELETPLDPDRLMALLLDIERAMGRERTTPKGPRTIDLDILLFDDREVHTSKVDIPHPAMHQRRFVLAPLAEIAPAAIHPSLHLTVSQLLQRLVSEDVVRVYSAPAASNSHSERLRNSKLL
jgi:2-amino-4-hydroxy-6-hydroxymethyldihydropteridine diphosphokinase